MVLGGIVASLFWLTISDIGVTQANNGWQFVTEVAVTDCRGGPSFCDGQTCSGPDDPCRDFKVNQWFLDINKDGPISIEAAAVGSVGDDVLGKCDKNGKVMIVPVRKKWVDIPMPPQYISYAEAFGGSALQLDAIYQEIKVQYIAKIQSLITNWKNSQGANYNASCPVTISASDAAELKGSIAQYGPCNINKVRIYCQNKPDEKPNVVNPPTPPPGPNQCFNKPILNGYPAYKYLDTAKYLGRGGAHKGADIWTNEGTPVYSPASWGEGQVVGYIDWFTPPWGDVPYSAMLIVYYPAIGKYVGYGEIERNASLYNSWVNGRHIVPAGTKIGSITDNGMNPQRMLHMEMYDQYEDWNHKNRIDPATELNKLYNTGNVCK